MSDKNLDGVLFSDGGREVTVQDLMFSKDIEPLFAGNKVLDPKPIVAEGVYYLFDGLANKWRKYLRRPNKLGQSLTRQNSKFCGKIKNKFKKEILKHYG